MSTAQVNTDIDDSDLIAIRNLLLETGASERDPRKPSDAAPKTTRLVAARSALPDVSTLETVTDEPRPSRAAALPVSEAPSVSKQASGSRAAAFKSAALRKIRAYRPRVKVIVGTSLVLLFLLHPVSMIGWTIVAAIFTLALYLIVGEERFWRGVLELHARYGRINPAAARNLGVRTRIAARKWNRWVRFLPQQMTDALQAPDLRNLMRAEARHDAALMDRLSRLDDE